MRRLKINLLAIRSISIDLLFAQTYPVRELCRLAIYTNYTNVKYLAADQINEATLKVLMTARRNSDSVKIGLDKRYSL